MFSFTVSLLHNKLIKVPFLAIYPVIPFAKTLPPLLQFVTVVFTVLYLFATVVLIIIDQG